MDEYELQTELSEKSKREITLFSEKDALEAEIQNQKNKIRQQFFGSISFLGIFILFVSLMVFFFGWSVDWLFFMIWGLSTAGFNVWWFYGLRKSRQKLEELQKIVEIENR